MKLNLQERIVLADILPQKGNFLELIVRKDLSDKISIKQPEIEKHQIKIVGDRISWESDEEIEVEFTSQETQLVKDQLAAMDKNKLLEDKHIAIYKKFNN